MGDIYQNAMKLRGEPRLFFQMAATCFAIIILGFGMNAVLARVDYRPLGWPIILHLILYIGWCLLAMIQPVLIARGNRARHRLHGWIGVALAILMGISGLWGTMRGVEAGRLQPPNIFLILNILTVAGFWALVLAAIVKRREMAWHNRLMTCSTILITGPAWARILPMEQLGPLGLPFISLAVLGLTAWGAIYDRKHRGRAHPAWWWGGGVAALIGPIAPPIAFLPSVAEWAARLASG